MRSIPINSSGGGVLSMKVLFKLPVVKSPLCLFLKVKNLQKQVRELKRLLGKKTMEVEILREAL
jgi:hypothetical protein